MTSSYLRDDYVIRSQIDSPDINVVDNGDNGYYSGGQQ